MNKDTIYNLVSGVTNNTTTLGVTNLTILYGVKTSAAAAGNNVDTYLNADPMTAADWSSVISVMIQLTFTNPLYTAGSYHVNRRRFPFSASSAS